MRDNIERLLELGLSLTLLVFALSSVYRITVSVGTLIEKNSYQRPHYTAEFSPNSGKEASESEIRERKKQLDQYYIASVFKRISDLEADEQIVYIDGGAISLSKKDEGLGIVNRRGLSLNAEDLRFLLETKSDAKLLFRFHNSNISEMRLD